MILLPACRRLLFPLRATKEIGDVCMQAMILWKIRRGQSEVIDSGNAFNSYMSCAEISLNDSQK